MGFGLELAPKHCQYSVDDILGKADVPRAKGFFDDVTVPGWFKEWMKLWMDSLQVLRALTGAGFMIGL